jgi:hypothetical protein
MDKGLTAISHAARGIKRNLHRLEQSAHRIASQQAERTEPTELTELTKPLVASIAEQRALEASANVLKRVDDALSYLLDILS